MFIVVFSGASEQETRAIEANVRSIYETNALMRRISFKSIQTGLIEHSGADGGLK